MEPGTGILVALVVSVLILLVVFTPLLRGRRPAPYAAKPLMTKNEREFILRLERALPDHRIHAQVSMGALMRPSFGEGGTKRSRSVHTAVRNRFAQKIVDFVVEDRATGRIVALVELDDRSHDLLRDSRRDAMTRAAGYRTVRWASRRRPTDAEIRSAVLPGTGD